MNSRSPHATQTITQQFRSDVTPELVSAVIEALQSDAAALVPGNPLRQQAESYADLLRHDVAMGRTDAIKRTLGDVLAFAANSAGLWASTLAILGGH